MTDKTKNTPRPFKLRTKVAYRTSGRGGLTEPRQGVVAGFADTLRGLWVIVKDAETKAEIRTRPALVSPLAAGAA